MKKIIIAGALSLVASPALAHLDPMQHGSFAAGFTHPISGVDHILVMVVVGLWAAMLGGQAVLAVPAAFVGVMLLGFIAALTGVAVPFVEPVILASVVALGLLVALALPVSALSGAMIVGFFAFFHGHAHGGEIGSATLLSYGAGFVLATVILHAIGISIGLAAGHLLSAKKDQIALRLAGGVTAIVGLVMMVG